MKICVGGDESSNIYRPWLSGQHFAPHKGASVNKRVVAGKSERPVESLFALVGPRRCFTSWNVKLGAAPFCVGFSGHLTVCFCVLISGEQTARSLWWSKIKQCCCCCCRRRVWQGANWPFLSATTDFLARVQLHVQEVGSARATCASRSRQWRRARSGGGGVRGGGVGGALLMRLIWSEWIETERRAKHSHCWEHVDMAR